jgi:hypothetical protein
MVHRLDGSQEDAGRIGNERAARTFRADIGTHFGCCSAERLQTRLGRPFGITMSLHQAFYRRRRMLRGESNRGCEACRFCRLGRFVSTLVAG